MSRRVLFLYLTKHSGHYSAAVATEAALKLLDGKVETMALDSFSHASPVLSKVTLHAYLAVLKAAPEIWEFMYDNPEFKERTRKIRELLNRGNSKKLQSLLDDFQPDAVVCTQGFACGVMASWKRSLRRSRPRLVGVLTDFVAHRYWADPQVDRYIVPTEAIRESLVGQGVDPQRVQVTGIPISSRFTGSVDRKAVLAGIGLKPGLPKILLMGGSLGLGPIKSVIRKLDKLPQPFEIIAVTGKNNELKRSLSRRGGKLRHQTRILGFVDNIHELMDVAEFVITKPGGITTAEALVKRLPMIIVSPIPGQEAKNTEYLLASNVAVEADNANEVMLFADEFFRNPLKLRAMRAAAETLGRADAAAAAANGIYNLLDGDEHNGG